MNLHERVSRMEGEMVQFLQTLVRIPSVKSDEVGEGAPFGKDAARALAEVLSWGENQGFQCKNIDGYAGHIEYGGGDETVGVLVHLDVVPAGEGWKHPPFDGAIEDGRIYGRGTIDDKGPAVASIFALKAIKESGLQLKRRIRIIFGCDEESNWDCMKAYFNAEPKPTLGFTPDGEFPLIFCEKGSLVMTFAVTCGESAADGLQLERLQGGTRRNVVPDQAECVLKFTESEQDAVTAFIKNKVSIDSLLQYEALTEDRIRIIAKGKAAHGSTPDLGENALTRLIMVLAGLQGHGKGWDLIRFLAAKIGRDTDGSGLGINASDEVSGPLTLNLGVLTIDGKKGQAQIDIRYPVSADGEKIAELIRDAAQSSGVEVIYQHIIPSHYVDPKSPLIKLLMETYQAETGDNSPPLAIGGRTYATTMGNAVAFGPLFPGEPELAHQRDENIAVANLIKCSQIYAEALVSLAT